MICWLKKKKTWQWFVLTNDFFLIINWKPNGYDFAQQYAWTVGNLIQQAVELSLFKIFNHNHSIYIHT